MSCSPYPDYNSSKTLDCKFPCPCTACKNKKRLETLKQGTTEAKAGGSGCAAKAGGPGAGAGTKGGLSTEEDATVNRFMRYASDIVSFLALLVFSTCMIWVHVLRWVVKLGFKVYQLDRRTQKMLALILTLLIVSISLNLLLMRSRRSREIATSKTSAPSKTCAPGKTCAPSKSVATKGKSKETSKTGSVGNRGKWCARSKPGCLRRMFLNAKPKTVKPRSYRSITIFKKRTPPAPPVVVVPDLRAKQVYNQSKLFAVPLEMKRPPALLAYLINFFRHGGGTGHIGGDVGNLDAWH